MTYQDKLFKIKMGILPKECVAKPRKPIPKISEKRIAELKAAKDENGETELVKWFKGRMKVMGDRCLWCGCKVENRIYQYAIFSICHILDKRKTVCPSVATHPLNFVTLCPDHHTEFDKMNWEERESLGFWEVIRDRLVMIFPDLAEKERRFFPQSVIDWMEKSEPF